MIEVQIYICKLMVGVCLAMVIGLLIAAREDGSLTYKRRTWRRDIED